MHRAPPAASVISLPTRTWVYSRVRSNLFGISIVSAVITFNKVIWEIISHLYDKYVYMPKTDEEWIKEYKGFIKNYEIPCVGAWEGFHVYVSTRLKNYYSFKNR